MAKEQHNPALNYGVKGIPFTTSIKNSIDTEGLKVTTSKQRVAQGTDISAGTFGVLAVDFQSEDNGKWGDLITTSFDTGDMVSLSTKELQAMDRLGGYNVTTTRETIDITGGVPAATNGLYKVGETIQQVDRAHAKKESVAVTSWEERVNLNNADSRSLGVPTTETSQVKANSFTMPSPSFRTLDQRLIQIDDEKFDYVNTVLDIDWPTFVHYEEEPETGIEVSVTETFAGSAPSFATNGTARFVEDVRRVDYLKWLSTQREIDSTILSTTITEYPQIDYYFPSYLDATDPFITVSPNTQNSIVIANRSSDHQFTLPGRAEITFHTTAPTASVVYQFKPIDIRMRSNSVSVVENDVLTDGGTLTLYEGNGATVEYTFPASSPTTTEYLALMGSEVLVSDTNSRWKFNLWRRVKIYMTVPNLSSGLSGSLIY